MRILPGLAAVAALALGAAACGTEQTARPVPIPDWDSAIAATRSVSPVEFTVEVLVEVDEEPGGGSAIAGVIDWESGLADFSPFEPITNTALSRIVVNGETAYVLSSAEPFLAALPEGREIVAIPTAELDAVLPGSAEELTGALGLLRGATAARQLAGGDIEVDIDLERAVASMSTEELGGLGTSLEGLKVDRAVSSVRLGADGAIELFQVRIEGTRAEDEYLLTGLIEIAPVTTRLTFDPPPPERVVSIDQVPAVWDLITP